MYVKPSVTRFGSFRELTRAGWDGLDDGFIRRIDGAAGCNVYGSCS